MRGNACARSRNRLRSIIAEEQRRNAAPGFGHDDLPELGFSIAEKKGLGFGCVGCWRFHNSIPSRRSRASALLLPFPLRALLSNWLFAMARRSLRISVASRRRERSASNARARKRTTNIRGQRYF